MPVTHIHDAGDFKSQISSSTGDRIAVADFSAKWCGPCKMIAPVYESLSNKHGHDNFRFLHIDVDEMDELAAAHSIRAMPTFVFFKNGRELTRIQGANGSALESKIVELATTVTKHYGEGNKLGGASGSTQASTSDLSADEIYSIAQSSLDVSNNVCKIGIRFMPPIQGVLANTKPTIRIRSSATVGEVRKFVDAVMEATNMKARYELFNSYPSVILDESKTIEQIGLQNSAIVIKFI